MKIKLLSALTAVAFALIGNSVFADSVVATYTCELKDGKKKEDVQAINSKWLKFVRDNVSKDISSSFGSAIVGQQDIFIFVDTYPDLETWAKAYNALNGEAASEIEGMFDETAECTENRLWKLEDTQ